VKITSPLFDQDASYTFVQGSRVNAQGLNHAEFPAAHDGRLAPFGGTPGDLVELTSPNDTVIGQDDDRGTGTAQVSDDGARFDTRRTGPVANPSVTGDLPVGFGSNSLPIGFVRFKVTGSGALGATAVTLDLPPGTPPISTYWNYGAEPGLPTPHWYRFLYDGH